MPTESKAARLSAAFGVKAGPSGATFGIGAGPSGANFGVGTGAQGATFGVGVRSANPVAFGTDERGSARTWNMKGG